MKRIMTLLLPAALAAGAFAQAPQIVPFKVGTNAYLNGMSADGSIATFNLQSGEELPLEIRVWDLTTGKPVDYTPAKLINWQGKDAKFPEGAYSQVHGANADGSVLVGTSSGQPAYFTVADLTWHELSMGSATLNRNGLGEAYSVSDDGSVICGWFSKGSSMTELGGCVWRNGEIVPLKNLPGYDDLLRLGVLTQAQLDEKTKDGETPNYTYRQVSADGTKVLAAIDHNQPGWGCSYFVYNLTDDTYKFILPETLNAGGFTESATMSHNGRYVTGTHIYYGSELEDVNAPYLFDTETGAMEIYAGPLDVMVLPTAVDDNGVIYGATPGNLPMRRIVIRSGTLWVDLMKTLDQRYGIDFYKATGYELSGYFTAVSGNGLIGLSQASMRDDAFVIKMPCTFLEATKGVSLLNDYAVSPEAGMKFSHLKEIMLRFSYSGIPVNGAAIRVEDKAGNKVAETSDIQSQGSQGVLYRIVFGDVPLAEGEEYTVVVPAGAFAVPDTEMTNGEIRIKYTGRADVPVKPVTIAPADGAHVMELTYSSPVRITFDTPLTVGNAVRAELFEEGKTAAMCTMVASAEGNVLTLYPTGDRKLSKDRLYTVKVPAGLVADIGFAGANEAFEINYTGTFVPSFTPTGNYAFFDSFDDPGTSLNNFMHYEGDHRQPTDEMASWGFDADNTPWNYSVRDSNDTPDFVAASHSMYATAGASDDWMVTPQLMLPNDKYFLNFEALRYKKEKADKLRIIVWESDDLIGSLDAATMARIKQEGKLLAEVSPKATPDGTLTCEWDKYDIPLADYSGKKIYIAFVNQNENQSALFVNNLGVEYRGDFTLSNATDTRAVAAASVPVRVGIAVNNDITADRIEATLTAGAFRSNYTATGLNLAKGGQYTFTFPEELPLAAGVRNPYKVSVRLDGQEMVFDGEVANHSFEISKRVLIEEGTGTWCGNCPLGEVALEHLAETMPDQIAVISVHNDDRMKFDEYDQFLAFGGYPKGRINRRADTYTPMMTSDETPSGDYEFTSPTGDVTFKDAVLSELSEGTEGEIRITDPVYFSADGFVNVPVEVRFSLEQKNAPYYVFTAILEDGFEYDQHNYFSGIQSEVLGWWAAQEGYVPWVYNNVARGVHGGFMGVDGRVPLNTKAGEVYASEGKVPMPSNVNLDKREMHFVTALIDARTGRVVNSDVHYEYTVNNTPGAGVETLAPEEAAAAVGVVGGTICFGGIPAAEVYTLEGRRIANERLLPGIYIARHRAAGHTLTAKVIVR